MSGEEYRRAMDTLARETVMPPESAARIERQLRDAFESRSEPDVVQSPRMKSFAWHPRAGRKSITGSWHLWAPVAAAIVVVALVPYVWRMNEPVTIHDPRAGPPLREAVEQVPPVAAVGPITTASSPGSVVTHATRPNRKPPKKTNVVTPSGFVDLPWTAGLPAFESGEIVRMDIPVASLPTYGIDISPGAGKGPVEADVLIGQDGLARQIRLVTTSSRSTQ